MIAAFISAIANAIDLVLVKVVLTRQKVGLRVFLPVSFIFLFLITMVLVPFWGRIDWSLALLPTSLFLFLVMIIMAVSWNVFYYQALKSEKLHQHELITMFAPLITILLAAAFYYNNPREFNPQVVILALIASVALIFARLDKSHLKLDQTALNLILAVVLMSTEAIVIRELLYAYSPVALYALRTAVIAGFFMLYYQPRYRQISNKHWWLIFLAGIVGVAQMIGRFYAFSEIGVIQTTLITVMAPAIVFLASYEILHERIRPKIIGTSIIILGCVVWAIVINAAS